MEDTRDDIPKAVIQCCAVKLLCEATVFVKVLGETEDMCKKYDVVVLGVFVRTLSAYSKSCRTKG